MVELKELEEAYQKKLSELKETGEDILEYASICNLTMVLNDYHGLGQTALEAVRIADEIAREKKLTDKEKFELAYEPFKREIEYREKIIKEINRECKCYLK